MSRPAAVNNAVRLTLALMCVTIVGSRAEAQRSETPAERCTWEGWLPPAAGRARVLASSALDAQQEAALRELARSPSKVRRQEAALKLAASREAASLDLLLELTNDAEPQVVDAAVRSLGRIGDRRATATLLPLVSAADAHVRQGAAWALGQLEDGAATDALISATRDDNKHVRTDATWALGLAGNRTAAVSRLIELTRDGEEHVRLAAVCSLARATRTGDARAREAIDARRADTVAVVRDAAVWAASRPDR